MGSHLLRPASSSSDIASATRPDDDDTHDVTHRFLRPSSASSIHGRNGRPEPVGAGGEAGGAFEESATAFGIAGGSAFAACALGRTFTVSFACRPEHRVMNSCMKLHATQAEHDAAREEWFALRIERQRERERKAKMAAAQEEFMREWWGLPEHVRLSRQKEMEQRGRGYTGSRPRTGRRSKRVGTCEDKVKSLAGRASVASVAFGRILTSTPL
ncbi:hypothetical protein MRS44_001895 [Fusarium solani]|uniref:uncharacterized protein n=1 Tax=Fusarium solani TaxID=169388 RepID=UPI0032C42A50|nr:hypothetical protein MRS44_001895 [Fusarium solani]